MAASHDEMNSNVQQSSVGTEERKEETEHEIRMRLIIHLLSEDRSGDVDSPLLLPSLPAQMTDLIPPPLRITEYDPAEELSPSFGRNGRSHFIFRSRRKR